MGSQLVQFRVTEDEFEDLRLAASGRGQSPHTYARDLFRNRVQPGQDSGAQLKELQRAVAALAARPSQEVRSEIERLHLALANATLLILHAVGMDTEEANRRVKEHVRKKVLE